MEPQQRNPAAKMQNLVRKVVMKKRSTTTVGGPTPLAASSFRGPKKGFLGIPKQRPPTQIEPELLETEIRRLPEGVIKAGKFPMKGMKVRMFFPEKSHGNKTGNMVLQNLQHF